MKQKLTNQNEEILTKMDASVVARLRYFSENLDIPLWMVIQNIIISDWARKAARVEIEGAHPSRPLPEFVRSGSDKDNMKTLTGSELFDHLTQIYKQELSATKANERIDIHQVELNKFLKPGEQAPSEEFERRKRDTENDTMPITDSQKASIKRADARTDEYLKKRHNERYTKP
jgi:hypothetical protein